MKRKTILTEQPHTARKRTTIYLPSSIHLTKPTSEINKQLVNLHMLKEILMDRTRFIDFYKEIIIPIRLTKETKAYQIVIQEQYNLLLYSLKIQTGLTISQIITICFMKKE